MELHPDDHNKFKCQWFDPQEDPREDKFYKCGAPAKHEIKVHGGVTKAFVFLCDEHKRVVNDEFAKRRQESAPPTPPKPRTQVNISPRSNIQREQEEFARKHRAG
jgi:hypothetical protein